MAHFMKKNHFITGFIVGIISPFVVYGILLTIFDGLINMGVLDEFRMSVDLKTRTLPLVALCTNAIWMQFFNRRHMTESMRGLVLPTLVLAGWWFWRHHDIFL